jgi:hypothetical protein
MRFRHLLLLVVVLSSLGLPGWFRAASPSLVPSQEGRDSPSAARGKFVPLSLRYRQEIGQRIHLLGAGGGVAFSAGESAEPCHMRLEAPLSPFPSVIRLRSMHVRLRW